MAKDFDDFLKVLDSDEEQARFEEEKERYLDDPDKDEDDKLANFGSFKIRFMLREYHEWVNS